MNTMPPVERDLPLDRHLAIRAELLKAIHSPPRRRWLPIAGAVGALGVVGIAVAMLVPGPSPIAISPGAKPTLAPAEPVIAGLDPGRRKQIEEGCDRTANKEGGAKLYNLITDQAGTFGLLYTSASAVSCTIDGPGMPFNAGYGNQSSMAWLPGHISVDSMTAAAGGGTGKTAKYPGALGNEMAVGRISGAVTKVTFTSNGETVDAVIANQTYVARIVHSATWRIPEGLPTSVVRAYDANGTLIGTVNDPAVPAKCYHTPDGEVVQHQILRPIENPTACTPAQPWR